jgi:hypothetical protein
MGMTSIRHSIAILTIALVLGGAATGRVMAPEARAQAAPVAGGAYTLVSVEASRSPGWSSGPDSSQWQISNSCP